MSQESKGMVFLKILMSAIILFLLPLLLCREEKAAAHTLPAEKRYLEAATPNFGLPPVIYTISPQAGHPGDIVNIYGKNFGYSQEEGGNVSFYREPVKVISRTDDMISIVVPMDTNHRMVPVQVTNLAGGSDFIFFEYLAQGASPMDLAFTVSPKSSYKAGQRNIRIPPGFTAKKIKNLVDPARAG